MKLESRKLITLLMVGLVIVQVSSLVVSKIINIPVIKLGNVILIILLASFLALLVNVSFNFKQLKREDIFFFFVIVGFLVLSYIYIPQYFPEIFSIIPGGEGIFSVIVP